MTVQSIPLAYPVAGPEGTITEVNLRRLRAADLTGLPGIGAGGGDDVSAMMGVLAALSGLTVEIIGELDLRDFLTVSEAAAAMIAEVKNTPATGPSAPPRMN